MIVFVDYEHASRYESDESQWIQAARMWITYRLEDLAGTHCMLVRYDRLTHDLLDRLGARAIFISGQSVDVDRYDPAAVATLTEVVRGSGLPVFGFCGGWQFCAGALGAALTPITVGPDHAGADIITEWRPGVYAEHGYHPVDLAAPSGTAGDHPLLDGLGPQPVFRHAHRLHVPEPPRGFTTLASTPVTPVQLAVDDDRRIVGAQFHPEYWTDEHPDGRRLIANFMRWVGLT